MTQDDPLPPDAHRNTTEVAHLVQRAEREARNAHRGAVVWLTGLSGAGKSTLAMRTERALYDRGRHAYVLDGDNVRRGLSSDLGFSVADRDENLRRVAELAALFADAGFVVISAFISPLAKERAFARSRFPESFHEVYVRASLAVCEARDPKGLYARARRHEIPDFTGISSPFEAPEAPDLTVDTEALDAGRACALLLDYIEQRIGL
jgi:bifunctional enzyme CysN/CysC